MQQLKAKINSNSSSNVNVATKSVGSKETTISNLSSTNRHLPLHMRGTAASSAASVRKGPSTNQGLKTTTPKVFTGPQRVPFNNLKNTKKLNE